MEESILGEIKELLNVPSGDPSFDADIRIHINSALAILRQVGIGPEEGYMISGLNNVWQEFVTDISDLSMVKQYVYAKTKKIFDPPASATVAAALDACINEVEWRLSK